MSSGVLSGSSISGITTGSFCNSLDTPDGSSRFFLMAKYSYRSRLHPLSFAKSMRFCTLARSLGIQCFIISSCRLVAFS
nr:hypothetical protein Iba_scaffold35352CG0010 [Ipomoea batatas]GMC83660.1 hypothetical protein Iba_chr04cCG4180 [Ipomoea batatas]